MKRTVLSLLAGLSAAIVAWRCSRGKHPATKKRMTYCPTCSQPMDREKWDRFMNAVSR